MVTATKRPTRSAPKAKAKPSPRGNAARGLPTPKRLSPKQREAAVDRIAGIIRASLDAAATTSENARHWRHTDSLSARAAFSTEVRRVVRERSRHEAENNSWYYGILKTAVNHIVGTGPRLQVLTDDPKANKRLERAWKKWAKHTGLTEKLRVLVETYWRDGEAFALRRYRPNPSPVPLEVLTYEAEQVSSPYNQGADPQVDDGIKLDDFDQPVAYWAYDHHPGDLTVGHRDPMAGAWYPAGDMIHLFRRERPGQIRGIPRVTPSLELFPKLRRHTAATLLAAEAVANWTMFIKTNSAVTNFTRMPEDFIALEFARNMMTFLPESWEPFQLKAEQPTTNHEMFQRQTLMEICRCFCMPLLLACGTSKDSNFSSAQMDIKNIWEPEVWSERERIETLVLERLWAWFLDDAVYTPGLLDGLPPIEEIDHQWFWDPLPVTNEVDAANAAKIRLQTGLSTHVMEFARNGEGDPETQFARQAALMGLTPQEYTRAIYQSLWGIDPPATLVPRDPAQPVQARGNRLRSRRRKPETVNQ